MKEETVNLLSSSSLMSLNRQNDEEERFDTVDQVLINKKLSPPKPSHHHNSNDLSPSRRKKRGDAEHDPLAYDLTIYFNMKNAKYIAIFMCTIFVFYHGSLNSLYGRNSCNRLLGEGHLMSDNEWQPNGCMIHKYTNNDLRMCFKYIKYMKGKNSFVFIGDSRLRSE
jgi:hypothetical protein